MDKHLAPPQGQRGFNNDHLRITDTPKVLVGELKGCRDLETGKLLHSLVIQSPGTEHNPFVASALISMYSRCGNMLEAQRVFDGTVHNDVVSWTSLILGYSNNGEGGAALEIFRSMDCTPNRVTLVAVLKACISLADDGMVKESCMQKGMVVHALARKLGLDTDTSVGSSFVVLYGKLGDMKRARETFDRVPQRDVVLWTTLIAAYVENGENSPALELFSLMDCTPNHVTLVTVLKACIGLAGCETDTRWENGRAVHKRAKALGLDRNTVVSNALIDMYSRCRDMPEAQRVFDTMPERDVVSWTTLISGYIHNEQPLGAMDVFDKLDCRPNHVTFVAVLKACTSLVTENVLDKEVSLEKGIRIHKLARKLGLDRDTVVANTLIDFYSKCGDMSRAREAFEIMAHRDVVSWNTLILGYVENGESCKGLEMFHSLDCPPDDATYAGVLKACGSLGALETGLNIHRRVCEVGWEQDEMLATCLLDFYGKCGEVAAARSVFERMNSSNVMSWSALMGGYSFLGDTRQVFGAFREMLESEGEVNGVIFLLVLKACSHAGMVEQGQRCFRVMHERGIQPSMEHYTCLVDMLGRANRMEEALGFVQKMPLEVIDSGVWLVLLAACEKRFVQRSTGVSSKTSPKSLCRSFCPASA